MSDSPTNPKPAADAAAPFRQKPSRNQKQRSKLRQLPEVQPDPPVEPVAAPPPPLPNSPAAEDGNLLRRMRLKRSGHMHEDINPAPDAKPHREDEY
ncbi:MAG: hypothetical protein ABI883_07750 [Chthoniobacterales bacterium]